MGIFLGLPGNPALNPKEDRPRGGGGGERRLMHTRLWRSHRTTYVLHIYAS